jgi:hypothetical protein
MNLAMKSKHLNSEFDAETNSKIHKFVWMSFRDFPIKNVTAELGVDHDDEQVINIVVEYELVDNPVDVKALIPLERNLRDYVRLEGIDLFVHVRHLFDDMQTFLKV